VVDRIDLPDATAEPEAYREALLDLVRDRDPLEIMERTVTECRRLVEGLDEDRLHRSPEPGEWSAAEVVAHLFDVDLVHGFRWRLVLTSDRPSYPGYDEKLWTPLPRPPFWQMFSAWEGLRASNLVLLRGTPREQWSRTGVHGEQGEEDAGVMVSKVAAHDLAHLNQIERAVAQVNRGLR